MSAIAVKYMEKILKPYIQQKAYSLDEIITRLDTDETVFLRAQQYRRPWT